MRSHRQALKSIEPEDQAKWSKRVDVALGGGSGVSHKLYEKPLEKGLPKTQGNAPFWMPNFLLFPPNWES